MLSQKNNVFGKFLVILACSHIRFSYVVGKVTIKMLWAILIWSINLSFNKVSHQEFSKMKQSNNEANLREEVLKNLATAYDNFVELVANLKEGTKVWCTKIIVHQHRCKNMVWEVNCVSICATLFLKS